MIGQLVHLVEYRTSLIDDMDHVDVAAQSSIELVWHDLKVYLSTVIRPTNKNQLIRGTLQFWNTIVTAEYCNSKIDHLTKVINEVIKLKGEATGL